MQPTCLTCISLWLVDRRPVFKFLWGLSLSGITGWIALQEGERACGFWSCVFYDKGIPFWIALLPWSPGGSGSGSRQSVCAVSLTSSGVCINPAIVLLLQPAEDCRVCAALRPALPALPSPASLHPTTARWPSCAWRILKSSSSVWDGVGDLAFHSREKAEALMGESGSWT